MNKRKLLKFAKMLNAFTELTTDNAVLISDGDIAVGSEVFISEGDEMIPAPDGEYKTENEVYVVVGGIVTEVKQVELDPITEPTEPVQEPTEPTEPTAKMAEPTEPVQEPTEPVEPTEMEQLKVALEDAQRMIQELSERLVKVEEAVQEPQAEPIVEPKIKDVKMDKTDTRLSAIAQAFARR